MPNRPDYIDLPSASYESLRPPLHTTGELPSPRTGQVPPALSPLDALALQGTILAKKFEEKKPNGRRISRLPPLTIANEFAKARPGYLQPLSAGSEGTIYDTPEIREEDNTPHSANETRSGFRPRSIYPEIQSDFLDRQSVQLPYRNTLSRVDEPEHGVSEPSDYFTIPRAESPEPIETRIGSTRGPTPPSKSYDRVNAARPGMRRTPTSDSSAARGYNLSGLAPPGSPRPARSPLGTPSIRSVRADSSDDVDGLSIGGSFDSLPPRKPSTHTSISRSHSPASGFHAPPPRSPSIASDYSYTTAPLPRPALNFSRPLSSAGRPSFDARRPSDGPCRQASGESSSTRPSFDIPSRQDSGDSPITPFSMDFSHTPGSVTNEDLPATSDLHSQPAPSYIYAKYSLPRGRKLQRESIIPQEALSQHFNWEEPASSESVTPAKPLDRHNRPATPPSLPRIDKSSSSAPKPPKAERKPLQRSLSANPEGSPKQRSSHKSYPSTPSTTSNASTIKANLARSKPPSVELTPEDHLQKGIELHEQGALQESTHHLRLAAKAGLPTAQLLYALACRHGWGMRPNAPEGVQWLQRAVDSSQLEVADDEDLVARGHPAAADTAVERRTHKAQFALGVYELGVSYMNGWGVRQDRALALRCFEVAGNWGDADALAEAGFCYTEGVGCRKDLRRAAKLYRAAAVRGMSMAGNSWIYKDKYMDDAASGDGHASRKASNESKSRDKSRTRTIFGRKKSSAS